jgi:CheY-like chemotaxis protein
MPDQSPAQGMTVLVVDDEPQVVWVLQFSLEAEGYRTYSARDGRQALKEVSEHHPRLMVLDIMMPEMDGWAVLEAMTKLPREERPRVVMVSALSSLRDRARAKELGADAFVPKPFNVDDLIGILHEQRWLSFVTTVVPTALHVRTGSSRNSAALSLTSRRGPPTFQTSNSHVRLELPTRTIRPLASIQSPAYRGARNSTLSYARKRPSSPSWRIASSVIRSPMISSCFAPATRSPP